MSRDITVFVDTDGTGYMISAARENYDLQIYRLTADYTGIAALVADPGTADTVRRLFKGGVYFMLTSGATGWNPNQQQYATATSIAGPWTAMTNVGDSTTYGSQTAYVLPVQGSSGTSYLYMGDRWGNSFGGTVNDSRYVWLPLTFPTSTTMSMSWSPEVTIDTATGTISGTSATYNTLIARHLKCADVTSQSLWAGAQIKQYDCNGGNNQKYWFKSVGGGYYQLMGRGQLPVRAGERHHGHPGELQRDGHRPAVVGDHHRLLREHQVPRDRRMPGRERRVHRRRRRAHHVHLQRRNQPAVDARDLTRQSQPSRSIASIDVPALR